MEEGFTSHNPADLYELKHILPVEASYEVSVILLDIITMFTIFMGGKETRTHHG